VASEIEEKGNGESNDEADADCSEDLRDLANSLTNSGHHLRLSRECVTGRTVFIPAVLLSGFVNES
jgi:hypothetical protein